MEQKKIDRISELTRLSRERELTPEEQTEREALRKEYIEDFRKATVAALDNTFVVSPDGRSRESVRAYNLRRKGIRRS